MKVQVKDEQGIDEAGNKHPAPGIDDGTHECELKWKMRTNNDLVKAGIDKEIKWADVNPLFAEELHKEMPDAFCQIWVLVEDNPFRFESSYGRILYKNIASSKRTIRQECENIHKAMQEYADQQTTLKSTRIAELQARVAELEGVLKEIQVATDEYRNYSHLLKSIQVVNTLATNALNTNNHDTTTHP